MAKFEWFKSEIDISRSRGEPVSEADAAQIPRVPNPTISFAHEYIHYLQVLGSLCGFRLFGSMLNIAANGTAILYGRSLGAATVHVATHRDPVAFLRTQEERAGLALPQIRERSQDLLREIDFLLHPTPLPYSGQQPPWSVVKIRMHTGREEADVFGFVVPPGDRFMPFNLAVLAEGIARQVDTWLTASMGWTSPWQSGNDSGPEVYLYGGIKRLLQQPVYRSRIAEEVIPELSVLVCSLALLGDDPSRTTALLLRDLDPTVSPAIGSRIEQRNLPTIARHLRETLKLTGQLREDDFDEELRSIAGPYTEHARVIEVLHAAAWVRRARTLTRELHDNPLFFVNPKADWSWVKSLMTRHGVPTVLVGAEESGKTAEVKEIDGVRTDVAICDLFREVWRVMF